MEGNATIGFELPPAIQKLIDARNQVRDHYQSVLKSRNCDVDLQFTLDGNLVGDIGEAIAVELFSIQLVHAKSTEGIDGFTQDGRSIQVKATGKGRGPAFRSTETRADHLLFFDLDFENGSGIVVFNGPEHLATDCLPEHFIGQRSLSASQIRRADEKVQIHNRLVRIDQG